MRHLTLKRRPNMVKKTRVDFIEVKQKGRKITFLTCCDYPTATFAGRAGLDTLLVRDSLGMCIYG